MDHEQTVSSRENTGANPLSVVIQVDSAIEFSQRGVGAETVYVANDRRTGKFYRFGGCEYHVVTLLNGENSLVDVHQQLTRDGLHWSEIDVIAFARELTQQRLATVVTVADAVGARDSGNGEANARSAGQHPASQQPAATRKQAAATTLRLMGSVLTQRFPIIDGDRVAARLLPAFGFLFGVPATLLWMLLIAVGVGVVWLHADAFSAEVRRVFDQQLWLVLGAIWCVLKMVHECGHAVCAKRHGVRVGKMGVMFFLLAPLAYVDVTDAWKLARRRDRIQIAMAGVYLELAIGAIAALVWWSCPVGFTKHLAAQIFLVAGPATLLVNANPLLRLDGYYVLSDLLEIPNLRSQGRSRLGALIEAMLFRFPIPDSPLTGWRRDVAVIHALMSIVFQIVWMSGLIIATSSWAKGLGIAMAAIATLMWGVLPLLRWMHKIWTRCPMDGWILNVYQRRLIALSTIVCLAIQYAAVNTSPLARRVPVVVRFQNEQIARAPADAFVVSVYVQCGERVEQGTLLMELEQPELLLKRDQLIDRRDVEVAKAIQHRRRGEIALSKTAEENAASLERQLAEVVLQVESLRILAERDGKITSPRTDRMLGRFVARGEELLRVSDPQEKEVLAVVAEDNLEAYKKAAAGSRLAEIRLRGGVRIQAPLKQLQPSASRKLPHPAMAVTVGGPLAVQLVSQSDSSELVHPQLQSVLPLDAMTSMAVESGQLGRLTIPDDRTILSRIWDQIRVH